MKTANRKKLLAALCLALSLVLGLAVMPQTAQAAIVRDDSGEYCIYTDGKTYISIYGLYTEDINASDVKHIVFPIALKYNGVQLPVTKLEYSTNNYARYAFKNLPNLESVTISSSILTVGNDTFANCPKLNKVTFSGTPKVTAIESSAFAYCKALTSITLPASVSSLGGSAFKGTGLTNVDLSATKLTTLVGKAFADCTTSMHVYLPKSVTAINANCFENDGTVNIHYAGTASDWSKVSVGTGNNLKLVESAAPPPSDPDSVSSTTTYTVKTDDAMIKAVFIANKVGTWTKSGVRLYNASGTLITSKTETHNYSRDNLSVWYNIKDELGVTLSPGSKYSFEIFTYYNGVCYTSKRTSFTTESITAMNWTNTVESVTENSITFTLRGEANKRGIFSEYGFVFYCVTGDYEYSSWSNTTDKNLNVSNAKFFQFNSFTPFEGLYPGYTYYYQCYLVFNGTRYNSDIYNFTTEMVTPPTLYDVYAKEDQDVTFSVPDYGYPMNYQWEFRASSSDSWSECGGFDEGYEYELTPASYYDGYQYRCRIWNWGSEVYTNAFTLHVSPKPTITSQPKSVRAVSGSAASFAVSASGGTDLKYQWYYRAGSSGSWNACTGAGADTSRYSVTAEKHRNGYQYRCAVTNSVGTRYSNEATLTVIPKTAITVQPKSVTQAVGTTAKFAVTATGEGLTYQWQYNGGTGWKNSTMTGAKTAAMSVPVTAARNKYQYRCKVTDANGYTAISRAATLTVKAVITGQPKAACQAVGTTAKFKVTATGAGLTYQWQFNGGTGWKNSTMTGAKTAAMSVPVTAARNKYQYRCKVTDANGYTAISSAATLTVNTVITGQPKSVCQAVGTTARFKMTATGAGLTYQWQYKTPTGSWTTCGLTGAKTATLSVPVTAARNKYQYRCKVTSANGVTRTSEAATLTVNTVITGQPKSVCQAVGTTARFKVTATGAGLTYQWQYKTPTGSWTTCGLTGAKTATLSVPVTAVRNGYQYRCKVTSANGVTRISSAAELTIKN